MFSLSGLTTILAVVSASNAAVTPEKRAAVQIFSPAAGSPTEQSSTYVGASNGSLPVTNVTAGKVFDRFIQIWLENTDYQVAASTPEFQALAKQGLTLDAYYAVTHPSEPNYMASMSGDFFGLGDDNYYAVPANITTVVDLLEDGGASGGNITWACYQESMPYDNYLGLNFSSTNYITPGAADYVYYERKHNPCSLHNSIANNTERAHRNRNFNDFAVDVNASALPQWMFVTPNMVDDGHDTSPEFFSNWTQWWLTPLLADSRFNDNRTLILLTFDENDSYDAENRVMSILLGGAVPTKLHGQTDSTYYTHYSTISTVQNNWQLKSLGRGDVNKTMANVFTLVANSTGYNNTAVPEAARPQTNLTGIFDGPLNANQYIPFYAPPSTNVVGAGGQGVLVIGGLNTSLTALSAPAPVNLTAQGLSVPASINPNITVGQPPAASSTPAAGTSGASAVAVNSVVALVGAVVAGALML
ncbi:hypothetical protein HWV62_35224 [Athelia sp. TMB]|nr:hypothetical protein HWV62_24884 [Athelia sp. TMB]KAF7986287.1 hypothetical protein HWV62_35224 [Athelia sp. TMB]